MYRAQPIRPSMSALDKANLLIGRERICASGDRRNCKKHQSCCLCGKGPIRSSWERHASATGLWAHEDCIIAELTPAGLPKDYKSSLQQHPRTGKASPRKTEDEVRKVAQDIGAEWIGKRLPGHSKDRIRLKCVSCGHVWSSIYNNAARGAGCRPCAIRTNADKHRLKLEDYTAIGASKGYTFLGVVPHRGDQKVLWHCPNGHSCKLCYEDLA